MIASSKRSPPMRAEFAYTTPFSDSTATSEVPPPMASTIEPRAPCTASPGADALIPAAIQRQSRDLRGAAADVEHHRAACLVHRQPGADCGGHRLADDRDAARARALGRLADRAPLHLRRAEGDAPQHPRGGGE